MLISSCSYFPGPKVRPWKDPPLGTSMPEEQLEAYSARGLELVQRVAHYDSVLAMLMDSRVCNLESPISSRRKE